MSQKNQRVLIVGGGFAGLHCALALRDHRFEITLIDRRNFHLFQPLLYQVATGGLSPADIASPLREILKHRPNVRVLLGEVTGFDLASRQVQLANGVLEYDFLVVAAGARHHYFGHEAWERHAPGLKSLEDATAIRHRVLLAFERAEAEPDAEARQAWLTFVVVGGGPTGVEMAGAIAELARDSLCRDFRRIDPTAARVVIVEGQDRVLANLVPGLSTWAGGALERLGITVRTSSRVIDVTAGDVALKHGDTIERLCTRTVIWAAGVRASPLGALLAAQSGAAVDGAGRVVVEPDFSVPGHREVFVIGDLASYSHFHGRPLPGVAPVAMQQGRYIAAVLRDRRDGEPTAPYRHRDRGDLATIGRAAAVGRVGRLEFTGFLAWLVWLFVHLMYLVGFENRFLVLTQWAWNYLTRNRSARLITGVLGPEPEPEAERR